MASDTKSYAALRRLQHRRHSFLRSFMQPFGGCFEVDQTLFGSYTWHSLKFWCFWLVSSSRWLLSLGWCTSRCPSNHAMPSNAGACRTTSMGSTSHRRSRRCGGHGGPVVFVTTGNAESLHGQQINVEHQGGVGWNDAIGSAAAIGQRTRNDQRTRATDLHANHAQVPALYHLAGTELE